MKVYSTQELRNLGIVGHGDAGKTSLVAAMLFATGATSRLGRVDEGTAPTDYDEEEISRKISLNITTAYAEHKGAKVNLIDTPGYAAFIAHARPAPDRSNATSSSVQPLSARRRDAAPSRPAASSPQVGHGWLSTTEGDKRGESRPSSHSPCTATRRPRCPPPRPRRWWWSCSGPS